MKNIILVILIAGFSGTVQAQFSKKTVFQQEWYLRAAGGVNYYLAEGYAAYPIKDALGFVGQASLGYRFNPVIGLRGNVSYTSHKWPHKENNYIPVSLSAENITLDLTVNLNNWISGYDKNRLLDFSFFAGAGAGLRNKIASVAPVDTAFASYIVRGGLQAAYRVSSSISLNVQGEMNVVADNYNKYLGVLFPFDTYPALSIGLSYRIPTNVRIMYSRKYNYDLKTSKTKKSTSISFK